MTAKSETVGVVAKVVRYTFWPNGGTGGYGGSMEANGDGDYVTYDDHESALASLEYRLAAAYEVKAQCNDAANTERRLRIETEAKLTTLLSGLEALAGEWESLAELFHELGSDISRAEAASMRNDAKQLRALIPAAAKEE